MVISRINNRIKIPYSWTARGWGLDRQHWARQRLVCHLAMNEGGGNKLYYISGNGNHGIINGALWKVGRLGFNGSSDYVSTVGDQDIKGTIIVKLTTASSGIADRGICGMSEQIASATHDRELVINISSKFSFYIFSGGGFEAVSTTTAVANTTYTIAATFDGVNIKIYVNGVWEATTAAGDPYTGYTTPEFFIGYAQLEDNPYWNNTIHYLRRYNRALFPSEIAELHWNPYPEYYTDIPWLGRVAAVAGVGPILRKPHDNYMRHLLTR